MNYFKAIVLAVSVAVLSACSTAVSEPPALITNIELQPMAGDCKVTFTLVDFWGIKIKPEGTCTGESILPIVVKTPEGDTVYDVDIPIGDADVWRNKVGEYNVFNETTQKLLAKISVIFNIQIEN